MRVVMRAKLSVLCFIMCNINISGRPQKIYITNKITKTQNENINSALTKMKAWKLAAYNEDPSSAISSMTLEEDVPIPEIGTDQVLVKVQYASVNPIDWKLFTGGLHGLFPIASFPYTPGFDITGVVEAIGSNVTNCAVGDSIVCDIGLAESCVDPAPPTGPAGAFAEYAAVPSSLCAVVSKDGKDLKDYAGLPLAGLTSYQALFTGAAKSFAGEDLGRTVEGSKVLILGAAGGTGVLAIQMAKNAGAFVAVTASTNTMPNDPNMTKIDFCRSLGADVVIDYKVDDWSETLKGQDYDLIYDCVGQMEDLTVGAPKVLKKGGSFVSITNFDPSSTSTEDVRFANYILKSDGEDLATMVKMIDDGKLTVHIDTVYPMTEVQKALSASVAGRATGKILIKIHD